MYKSKYVIGSAGLGPSLVGGGTGRITNTNIVIKKLDVTTTTKVVNLG